MKTVKNHTPGKIRYFTYIIEFEDGETRMYQISFVHPLDFELKQTNWYKFNTSVYRDLLSKGEARLVDNNRVKWCIRIENDLRPGVKQLNSKPSIGG